VAICGPTGGVSLHRFFVAAESLQADRVSFSPEHAHQIRSVLRLRPGDRVVVLDGSGAELVVRLDTLHDGVAGTVEERSYNQAEPQVSVVLYQGLLKAAKFELVLQKCTEIGVSSFVPMITDRSIPSEPSVGRQRRFETIVREAAEQSRRGRLPGVSAAVSYEKALTEAASAGRVAVLWEDERTVRLRDVSLAVPGAQVGLFVGPEGGLTPQEVALARDAGASVVSLGKRILRAETAAIVGSALVVAQAGALG
jgi:16S rRNA (uracil1498-N3)-methyltransferase